ncbi:hypothetical protein EHP00_1673 [Ecytonucleospora hepatopenaei]|uniref:Uncharacterized protein n=1 Tax=Ecytonucleospora hepatopenaei TaxID=646526 RepID=A0A1W0E332_9MICR|nr:hypothetical protein EHP00_1673 [Ecytonucleospora hepatopenaei]
MEEILTKGHVAEIKLKEHFFLSNLLIIRIKDHTNYKTTLLYVRKNMNETIKELPLSHRYIKKASYTIEMGTYDGIALDYEEIQNLSENDSE